MASRAVVAATLLKVIGFVMNQVLADEAQQANIAAWAYILAGGGELTVLAAVFLRIMAVTQLIRSGKGGLQMMEVDGNEP